MPRRRSPPAATRIGYVPGPGDEVPASLRSVGYDVTLLGDEALAAGAPALARFDAIVIGVRAFNTSERLRAAHAALMAYVERGRHAGRPVQHQQPARRR